MSLLESKLKEELDPLTHKLGTIPFIITNISGPNGILYSSSTSKKTDEPEILAIYSCTKPMTTTCVLQLYERGLLDVEDYVEKWIPEAAELQILEGWDDNDEPILIKATKKMKVIHLLTHTSGLGYPNLFERYYRYHSRYEDLSKKPVLGGMEEVWRAFASVPLMFEPGEAFTYGTSIDWCGRLVESVSGMDLEEYMKKNLFEPIGMNDSAFRRSDYQYKLTMPFWKRNDDEGEPFIEIGNQQHPQTPEMACGGQGLFSTIDDLAKFLKIFINDGKTSSGESILSIDTLNAFIE